MIKDAPEEVQNALEILWQYADDACLSGRSKKECESEGYGCSTNYAHYITLVLPNKNAPSQSVTPSSGCIFCDLDCCTPDKHVDVLAEAAISAVDKKEKK